MSIDARSSTGGKLARLLFLVTLVLLAGGVVLHGRMSGSPLWTVRTIEIEGNRSMTREALLGRLGLESGMSWWQISRQAADDLLAEEPRLRAVDLRYAFPRGLEVRIAERQSVLLLVGDPLLALAEDGRIIETDDALDPADLPCLTGAILDDLQAGNRLDLETDDGWWEQLMQVRADHPDLWRSISQIECEKARHYRIFFRSGRRLLLWDPMLNDHLWAQIPRILEGLAARDLDDDIVLDMRFRDRVVVRYPEDRLKILEEESGSLSGEDSREEQPTVDGSESQEGDQV